MSILRAHYAASARLAKPKGDPQWHRGRSCRVPHYLRGRPPTCPVESHDRRLHGSCVHHSHTLGYLAPGLGVREPASDTCVNARTLRWLMAGEKGIICRVCLNQLQALRYGKERPGEEN